MDTALALAIFLIVGVLAIYGCATRVPPSERAWLVKTLALALALRLVLATVFALAPSTRLFHEDADGYEWYGSYIARSWRGQVPEWITPTGAQQNLGYFYVCAALYYLFGLLFALPSYLNCVLGTVVIFFVYRLSCQLFHPLVARSASRFAAMLPSMVLWSAIAVKDTLVTLLILMALSGCLALKRRFSLAGLVATTLPVVLVQPVRFYMVYFLIVAIVLSLTFERGARSLSGVPKQIMVLGVLVGMVALIGLSGKVEEGAELMTLERLSRFREGMASTAQSGFATNVDISTPLGAVAFLPVGMAVLLLGPFPWQMTSLRALFAAPETMLCWVMIPSLLRGLRFAIRTQFARVSPLVLFTGTLTVAYSLVHGNVGSAFRQRAQIFVFLFIFAAVGWYQRRCRAAGIDERHLIQSA